MAMRYHFLIGICCLTIGCSQSSNSGAGRDSTADVQLDTAVEHDLSGVEPDVSYIRDARAEVGDTVADQVGEEFRFKVKIPLTRPVDPLDGTDLQSCSLYQEITCVNGRQLRCRLYDTSTTNFVDKPDGLLHRTLLYDRWFDKYHSPHGMRAERNFTGPIAHNTPESEWGKAKHFAGYRGGGDSAIFTGGALLAKIYRYVNTGTKADYQRMETQAKMLLNFFDVTGIPGYLARYHYLKVADGTPNSDKHYIEYGEPKLTHRFLQFDPKTIDAPYLPSVYVDGYTDSSGKRHKGTPMFSGNPSIDQYGGPTVALPLAYALLKDEDVKKRIVMHVTCYLKRLKRIEVINLQKNEALKTALTTFLSGSGDLLALDPDDPDLLTIDRIVVYTLRNLNPKNRATYDTTCPDKLETEPSEIIDASADDWLLQAASIVLRLQSGNNELDNGVDHFYAVNLRGGDAAHMMRLAATAYYLTGEQQYKTFLNDELIGKLKADQVAKTIGAISLPDWCYSFFADHITLKPLWGFLTMLDDSPLKTTLQTVMETEAWQKRLKNQRNMLLSLLYLSETPKDIASGRDAVLSYLLPDLLTFGGNGGTLDAPRRNYSLSPSEVIAGLPNGLLDLRFPTTSELSLCNDDIEILGFKLPRDKITYQCDSPKDWEHKFGDGACVRKLTKVGVPATLRRYEGFQWERSGYELGKLHGNAGKLQAPGTALMQPYWIARHYGFVTAGRGQVLVWRDTGECE